MKTRIVPGTVRFKAEGSRRYTYGCPGRRSYASLALLATEYYNGKKWVPYVPGIDDLSTVTERKRS